MNKLLPLLALLAGCSFIPNYERPVAPMPEQWPVKVGAGETAHRGDWSTYFTDPQLQKLITAALEHNRDLRIAVARVDEARALAGIARADRFPTVDVNLQQQAAKVPGDLNTSGQSVISRRYDANLGVAAFELDFWGRVASLETASRANFFASEFAQRSFRLSLIADVASAYYSLAELDARLTLAEATAQTRARSRYLIEQRRDVGLATDLDFLAADGAYQSARAEEANLARQRASAENALRLLVGNEINAVQPAPTNMAPHARNPGSLPPTGGASAWGGPVPTFAAPAIAVGLPSEVLLNRPDVLAAEQKLIAANANIGAARAAFLPKIVLTATAGTASHALSGLFGGGSGAWSFVPLLKWPLFDAGRSEANVDLAEVRKHIAVAEYEKAIQQAFREVADLLAAREHYAVQLQALEAAATAQTERLNRVGQRHLGGVSSYLELLDAQREHFTAQQSVLATRRALAATSASLYKALGGS
jgi:multidrug efflux system outer membrane protein